jgi:uncharacterized membrane protein YfcA
VRLAKLAGIGIAAGAFSGLFGVGGGTVIVPLLIVWFAYGEREATGTSLAAIVIAVPAVAGVIVGATVQQRIPQRAISLAFAVMLVAVAVQLVVE